MSVVVPVVVGPVSVVVPVVFREGESRCRSCVGRCLSCERERDVVCRERSYAFPHKGIDYEGVKRDLLKGQFRQPPSNDPLKR